MRLATCPNHPNAGRYRNPGQAFWRCEDCGLRLSEVDTTPPVISENPAKHDIDGDTKATDA